MASNGELSAREGASEPPPVLRISQLDAFELDATLEQLLWTQFSRCFQHFRPGQLTLLEPELKALLQLLLWRFTVYSRSATAGQTLLHICYRNELSPARRYRPMSRGQKLGFALCTVGSGWLAERSHSRLPLHARRAIGVLGGLLKAASLLNFLLFLQRGTYPSLTERLLGVRAVFSRQPSIRDVGFQHMNRELLWHGFAEFLIFLLPLVSVRALKARLAPFLFQKSSSRPADNDCRECGLCGEWPTMPHSLGCGHVFCYYCIKSHTIAQVYPSCPVCGLEVQTVQPCKVQVEMTDFKQT